MRLLKVADSVRRGCALLAITTLLFAGALDATSNKPLAPPININSANSAQLQQVPGIGPATADNILQMCKSYGAFKGADDLLAIRGLGPKRLEKMRKYLVAGKSPGVVPKAPGANSAEPAKCPGCEHAWPATKFATAATRPKVTMKKEVAGTSQVHNAIGKARR